MISILEARHDDFDVLIAGRAPQGYVIAEGGIESSETLIMLRDLAASVRAMFSPAAWLIAKDTTIVGMCSVLAAPTAAGSLSIGYGVAPAFRGQHIATNAISAVISWARTQPELSEITAETSVSNQPSQRVLESNEFLRIGERSDVEDGQLICWAKDVGQSS